MKSLREFTMARVALGRAGNALPTRELLELRRARAGAGDAVHESLDLVSLRADCDGRGWEAIPVQSQATDRIEYLRRPDLGRALREASHEALRGGPCDAAIILADGLSARAVHRHAIALLEELLPKLQDAGWSLAPLVLVEQGRVAIGDDIGELLGAAMTLILIGERPGLSAADSLGAYLTWSPVRGRTDAERNCVSNIRPEGLAYGPAAEVLFNLMTASRAKQLSGIALKQGASEFQPSSGKD